MLRCFRHHNHVCVEKNIVRNAMCYIFSIPDVRVYDNKGMDVSSCPYPVQNLKGLGSGNLKCPKTEDECTVVETLNNLSLEEETNTCANMF